MSVTGTPITPSSPTDSTSCTSVNYPSPTITQLYGVQFPTKRRAILIPQGQLATAVLPILNSDGNPIDLSLCSDNTFQSLIREIIALRSSDIIEATTTVSDAGAGEVSVAIPSIVASNPGVYLLEVGWLNDDDELIGSNRFYLWVDRGLFATPLYPMGGPPSVDNIRLFMRDNAPEENRLIDEFEFDLAELCHAAELGVRIWNESQPPVGISFSTCTYPAKERWLYAIAGQLLIMAAHRFRRNQMASQAGGISIDDQNKHQQYEVVGLRYMQEYREWVKQKKAEINAYNAMTTQTSPYAAYSLTLANP